MNLSRALKIEPGDVVAFVGGGGKSTTLFRLGRELAAAGKTVLLTTSTRIFADQIRHAPAAISFNTETQSVADILPALKNAVAAHGQVLLTGQQSGVNAFGIPTETITALAQTGIFDVILNEADGSRRRSFKAPAAHEPVIPAETTLVAPVVGLDVLGKPLTAEAVHRPEIVGALAGVAPQTPITPQIIAAVLAHPHGGLKAVPPAARVIPLLNKLTAKTLPAAKSIARQLLATNRILAVVMGTVANDSPIERVTNRVAAIVLAAGEARRFGSPKQLAMWRGKPLLAHTVDAALTSAAQPVSVVLGAHANAVRAALGNRPVHIVENPRWQAGMSASLQAGLSALPQNVAAVVVVLADQPRVRADTITALIDRYQRTLAPLVAPTFNGKRGNPILIDRQFFAELMRVRGDVGARPVVQAHVAQMETVAVTDPAILHDIDTPLDLDGLNNSDKMEKK